MLARRAYRVRMATRALLLAGVAAVSMTYATPGPAHWCRTVHDVVNDVRQPTAFCLGPGPVVGRTAQ
jgi:hypothetical protein